MGYDSTGLAMPMAMRQGSYQPCEWPGTHFGNYFGAHFGQQSEVVVGVTRSRLSRPLDPTAEPFEPFVAPTAVKSSDGSMVNNVSEGSDARLFGESERSTRWAETHACNLVDATGAQQALQSSEQTKPALSGTLLKEAEVVAVPGLSSVPAALLMEGVAPREKGSLNGLSESAAGADDDISVEQQNHPSNSFDPNSFPQVHTMAADRSNQPVVSAMERAINNLASYANGYRVFPQTQTQPAQQPVQIRLIPTRNIPSLDPDTWYRSTPSVSRRGSRTDPTTTPQNASPNASRNTSRAPYMGPDAYRTRIPLRNRVRMPVDPSEPFQPSSPPLLGFPLDQPPQAEPLRQPASNGVANANGDVHYLGDLRTARPGFPQSYYPVRVQPHLPQPQLSQPQLSQPQLSQPQPPQPQPRQLLANGVHTRTVRFLLPPRSPSTDDDDDDT
ncbi:hypothetical protein N7492_008872 [Penicillium capsulatum]|uniref:Uncharacterized protein n=1 Tax=Penicillium capsulatum TaxID=69766 RepID=A0A9W9HTJ7_9EURO|nr:hypothetical protein N7492_008872 [Penicillium capsulatum]KAJ6106274.1 hypothetical protein N7512_009791 [Penicillium capsulatum]